MFENPRRGRQARNFATNVPKILDLKSSSEQTFFRKLSLGAPVTGLGISPYKHFSTKTSVNERSSLVHLGNQAVTRSIKFISRSTSVLWSAICLKIMIRHTCGFFPRILAIIPATRYTCVFLPRILAFFPALWGF